MLPESVTLAMVLRSPPCWIENSISWEGLTPTSCTMCFCFVSGYWRLGAGVSLITWRILVIGNEVKALLMKRVWLSLWLASGGSASSQGIRSCTIDPPEQCFQQSRHPHTPCSGSCHIWMLFVILFTSYSYYLLDLEKTHLLNNPCLKILLTCIWEVTGWHANHIQGGAKGDVLLFIWKIVQ